MAGTTKTRGPGNKAGALNVRTKHESARAGRKSRAKGKQMPARPPREDLLMRLPPELRNVVYEMVLIESDPIPVRFRNAPLTRREGVIYWVWREPGILRASKKVRLEAKAIYYLRNTFDLNFYTDHFRRAERWIHRVTESIPANTMQVGRIHIARYTATADSKECLALVRLFKDAKISFKGQTELSKADLEDLFVMSGPSIGRQQVYMGVVQLAQMGVYARAAQWTEHDLMDKFLSLANTFEWDGLFQRWWEVTGRRDSGRSGQRAL